MKMDHALNAELPTKPHWIIGGKKRIFELYVNAQYISYSRDTKNV